MKYLITGGAGFIGSHLAECLIDCGHHVHVIDNLSTGDIENIKHLLGHERFKSTIGDILDEHLLEGLVAQNDEVFHFAAAVGVRLIIDQPVETIMTNVRGTENVLKHASNYQKKVFIASTSEVYGKMMDTDGSLTHLAEDDDWTLGPTIKRRWAYACSKAIDEFLALAYYREKDLPVVIARFFNTVGPRQTGRYGMVIPNFVLHALAGEPIQVYGNGNQTRCFLYVEDAVKAAVELIETQEAEGGVFNIGSEEEISIRELAERVKDLTGSQSDIIHIPYEEAYGPGFEDIKRRTPDISKIRSTIGFEPSYALDQILYQIIDYYQKKHQVAPVTLI